MKISHAASRTIATLTALLLSTTLLAQSDIDLDNEENQIGYAIGVNIGQNLVSQQILSSIDQEAFMAGLADAIDGNVQLDQTQMMAAVQTFMERQQAAAQSQLSDNLAASEDWLEENAERSEVTVLDSGLQYEVLEEGPAGGESPSANDSVLAHYHGTLTDGTVFDSSVERGEPATFGLNQVIAGWTEALQLMSVGDKWRLYIPPAMAYGESSPTPAIPPNSALIFDVELLEVR